MWYWAYINWWLPLEPVTQLELAVLGVFLTLFLASVAFFMIEAMVIWAKGAIVGLSRKFLAFFNWYFRLLGI